MSRALAVFAKTPIPGQVKTRLLPHLHPEEGAELYRCMLFDTLSRVRGLSLKTFVFFEGEESFFAEAISGEVLIRQHPGGLGERLEHAFAEMAREGFQLRAAIGSDAPDLPLSYIEEAFTLLQAGNDSVFGPAEDGGYYLVGLKGRMGGIFQEIPWSTSGVLARSLARAAEGGLSCALLPPWYDVDCYDDLWRPGLCDPASGAALTRRFIAGLSSHRALHSDALG